MSAPKVTIHFNVADANRSVLFYQALLGVAPVDRGPSRVTFDVDSPPLILVLEELPHRDARKRATKDVRSARQARAGQPAPEFTLVVNEPRHVGIAAVALRRVGARLRLEDSGIVVSDPDENGWHVRWVPTAHERAIHTASLES